VQPADDHTPDGTMCFTTGQSFFQQLTYGRTILNSPSIDLSSSPDVQITYWRWYVNGADSSPNRNVLTAQASVHDGLTWHTTEVVGPGSASDPNVNPGWRFASWRLSTVGLAPSATTRVRFIAENAFGSGYVMALIDDFAITGVTCAPPPARRTSTPTAPPTPTTWPTSSPPSSTAVADDPLRRLFPSGRPSDRSLRADTLERPRKTYATL